MSEYPKFDLGHPEIVDQPPEGIETALKFFKETPNSLMYEGSGYIWRATDMSNAIFSIPSHMRPDEERPEEMLQKISQVAKTEFNKLASFGIRFDGKFLVYEVNGELMLLSVVPKIEHDPKAILSFETQGEWDHYLDRFTELYENLLTYFDVTYESGKPILYDVARRAQYVYDESGFTLIDPDCYLSDEDGRYALFIAGAMNAIEALLTTKLPHAHTISSERMETLRNLLLRYEDRMRAVSKRGEKLP